MSDKAYLDFLINQFKKAKGISDISLTSSLFVEEFSKWITSRQDMNELYLRTLSSLELSFNNSNTYEIGKSTLDSAVKDLNTVIITPYVDGLTNLNSRVIKSDFKVDNGKPVLLRNKEIIVLSGINMTFMTQNPYTDRKIENWEQLGNSKNSNIIVGVFGSIHDKDKDEKVYKLLELGSKIENTKEKYLVLDDVYCCVIASKSEDITEKTYGNTKTFCTVPIYTYNNICEDINSTIEIIERSKQKRLK